MTISDIGTVFGICVAVATGGGAAGKYYLDNEYVSNDAFLKSEIRELRREKRRLERIADPTDDEIWLLHDIINELEQLEDEL